MAKQGYGIRIGIDGFADGAIDNFKKDLNSELRTIGSNATIEIGHMTLSAGAKTELENAIKNNPLGISVKIDDVGAIDFSGVQKQLEVVQKQVDSLNAGFANLGKSYTKAMRSTATNRTDRDHLNVVRADRKEADKQYSNILNIGDVKERAKLLKDYNALMADIRKVEDQSGKAAGSTITSISNRTAKLIQDVKAVTQSLKEAEQQATKVANVKPLDQADIARQQKILNDSMKQIDTSSVKIVGGEKYEELRGKLTALRNDITETYSTESRLNAQSIQELQARADKLREEIELERQRMDVAEKAAKAAAYETQKSGTSLDKEMEALRKSLDGLGDGAQKDNFTKQYDDLKQAIDAARASDEAYTTAAIEGHRKTAEQILAEVNNAKELQRANSVQAGISGNADKIGEFVTNLGDDKSVEAEKIRQGYENIKTAINNANSANQKWTSESIKNINDQIDAENKLIDAYAKSEKVSQRANSKANAMEKYLADNPRVAKSEYGANIREFIDTLRGRDISPEGVTKTMKAYDELKPKIREAGLEGKTFWDILRQGYEKFGTWTIVTKTFQVVMRTMKQMVSTVIELDTAMTELRKVTNLTAEEYDQFGKKAATIAKSIGATMTDVIKSTADFARLGYSVDEAAQLAQAALVYKNVGDGITDVNVATESLISTMKAFGVQAQDSMYIVDMFNEVGNNFAISSSGIGDALVRSASALNAAGNTIQESIGLVTAMNSVIQDPDAVGELCAQWHSNMSLVSMYNG